MEKSESKTKPGEHALNITRVFDAPLEKVWRAWTEPEEMKRWYGPKDYTAPVCEVDLRVGGKMLACMRSPEGTDFWSTGTYLEIVPFSRLVCTDSFADEVGRVVPASHYGMEEDFPLELLVTVNFEDLGSGRSRFNIHHVGFSSAEMAEMTAAGWNESFDKLAASLT